jgi:hypothetical protein
MEIMNVVEKRDFIHRHLHQADENLINSLYESLQKSNLLKEKLTTRAQKSEQDIKAGRVFSRNEIEKNDL